MSEGIRPTDLHSYDCRWFHSDSLDEWTNTFDTERCERCAALVRNRNQICALYDQRTP